MKKADYFLKALELGFLEKSDWVRRCFLNVIDKESDEFLYYDELGRPMVYLDDSFNPLLIEDHDGGPLLRVDDLIDIEKGSLRCLDKTITTTYGILMVNYLFIEKGLSGKIPYINGEISLSKIEDILLPLLTTNPERDEVKKPDIIYVDDLIEMSKAELFVQEWANIFTVSKSRKAIQVPPELEAAKKNKLKEMEKKYGDRLWTEEIHSVEYDDYLKAIDREFLKDDPSFGIVLSNKIIGQSRKKRLISFGFERNPFNHNEQGKMITRTLNDGISLKREDFPTYVNSIRSGSLFRGVETQQSGSIAKSLVMATMGLSYEGNDCKTKKYRKINNVERGKRFIGRYHKVGDKILRIDKVSDIEGKTILLRSPMHCIGPISKVCKICAGDSASRTPTAPVLQATKFGGDLVNGDMKKMHGSEAKVILVTF